MERICIPNEIILLIALFISFPTQYKIFTRLNKELRRLYDTIVLPDIMELSLTHPSFIEFNPSPLLFNNTLDVIADKENIKFVQYLTHKLALTKVEFFSRYYNKSVPTFIILRSIDFRIYHTIPSTLEKAWAKRLQDNYPYLVFASKNQSFGIAKYLSTSYTWHFFTFPKIYLKPIAGIAYWFSVLLEAGNNSCMTLGVKETKVAIDAKQSISDAIPNGFNVSKLKKGEVLTVCLEFAKTPFRNLHQLLMSMTLYTKIIQGLSPLQLCFVPFALFCKLLLPDFDLMELNFSLVFSK